MTLKINNNAPVVQSKEILIQATPEKIWSLLTDINQWSTWNTKIKNPKINGELEVGTTFTWTNNGSKINSTIQACTPNKIFGWTGKALGASAIHIWYIEPEGNGTKVRVEESMEGWIVSLMKKKMNSIVLDDMTFWLEQLKKESEKKSSEKPSS